MTFRILRALLLATLLFGGVLPVLGQSATRTENPQTCVTDYDETVDYFPDKATFSESENLTVEYFNHYKVVTVTDAFDNAPDYTYVLVQCGTPAPDAGAFPEGTQFTEVPVTEVIALSTTQLPMLDALEVVDRLVAVDGYDFINTPSVLARIEAGEVVAVGAGAGINVEVVLDLDPSVVMAYGFDPTTDAHPVLLDAGVVTALDASWREGTPLGRAEWLKFTGLFFNKEAEAAVAYDRIEAAYNAARDLAATIPEDERPTVLWNYFSPFSDSWTIPGAETYAGVILEDAGVVIAYGEAAPTDSVDVSFEVVYEAELDADIWVTNAFGMNTYDDLLASDPRFADFEAAQTGNVWNNTLDVNENGGNNYYELGVTNPHLILQDMVAIFYPELLPDHEFMFFQPLD